MKRSIPSFTALCLFASTLAATSALAQVDEAWRTQLDGGAGFDDDIRTAAVTSQGSFVLAGYAGISAPIVQPWIVKLDSAGALVWSKTMTLPTSTQVRAIGADSATGRICVGICGFGTASDIRVAELDAQGNFPWTTPPYDFAGREDLVTTSDCIFDASGNVYVAGSSVDTAGRSDVVVFSYDSTGTQRWITRVDAAGLGLSDWAYAMSPDSQGNLIVVGSAIVPPSQQIAAMLTIKIDPNGNVVWTRTFPANSSRNSYANDVVCDATNHVYVCGQGDGPNFTRTYATLIEYDAAGNLLWSRSIDPGANEVGEFTRIALDPEHRPVCAGTTHFDWNTQPNPVPPSPDPTRKFLTTHFDSAGNTLWSKSLVGTNLSGLVVDASGDVTIGGTTFLSTVVASFHVARYEANGNLRWSSLASNSGQSFATTLLLANDGTIVQSGSTLPAAAQSSDLLAIDLKPQVRAFCFGDGSSAACPCANASSAGAQTGCVNSLGSAAHLTNAGSASLSNDTLTLTSSGELPLAATLLFQGSAANSGSSFGDGVRCVVGSVKRLYTKNASGGVVTAPASGDPSISTRVQSQGDLLLPGSTRYYQAYYRDPSPSFCPAPSGSTWNTSSALAVTWVQ